MLPIILISKVLQELELLQYIYYPFSYIMEFFNIPEVYSLAWLLAIFNVIYSVIPLMTDFSIDYPLTVAQMTTLGALMLMFHSVFIEGALASKLGINALFFTLYRLVSALLFGYSIYLFAYFTGWGSENVQSLLLASPNDVREHVKSFGELYSSGMLSENLLDWLKNIFFWLYLQLRTLVLIAIVITVLFFIVELVKYYHLITKINFLIKPFMQLIKLHRNNYMVTFLCIIVGLTYSWGILRDEKINNVFFKRHQLLKSLLLIAICHAIIEDGLVIFLLGANIWIVILGRLLFAILLGAIFSWLIYPLISPRWKKKLYSNNKSYSL